MESYCVKQKKVTLCIPGSERYEKAKNGRLLLKCTCSECGITKTKFVSQNKDSPYQGAGIGSTLLTSALDLGMAVAPIIGKKALQAGKYYASEAMRNPKLQQKAIDYALDHAKPILSKVGKETITQLSASIRPKRKDGKQMHKTDIKGLDYGGAIDIQKHLSKLGEIHMRTPSMKRYNYCGPGTQLEKRLASNDPKIRDPINELDSICQRHDIAYSEAKSLKDKHKADDVMLDEISKIPYMKRPWGTLGVQALIKTKRKLGLGVKKKDNQVKKKTGKKN